MKAEELVKALNERKVLVNEQGVRIERTGGGYMMSAQGACSYSIDEPIIKVFAVEFGSFSVIPDYFEVKQ